MPKQVMLLALVIAVIGANVLGFYFHGNGHWQHIFSGFIGIAIWVAFKRLTTEDSPTT